MTIAGKLKGVNGLKRKFALIQASATKETQREMTRILVDMDRDIKRTIQSGGRSGNIYKVTKSGATHQASAPGEAPKSNTGNLAASFKIFTTKIANTVIGNIENFAQYAKYLEFKPKSAGGRPFMRPLYNRWRKNASQRLRLTIKSGIKRIARG